MTAIRFVTAVTLLLASPHPSWSRLASIPSPHRFLEAGTCSTNGAPCETATEDVGCRGCFNNGSFNGKSCSTTDDCKGKATCEDGPVGSCVTGGGGGGGGDGTCSSDGSSCSTNDQCTKCVGGKNDGNVCSVASDCNKGGGVCTPGTCNNTGGGPTPSTPSPSESPSDVPSDLPSKSPTKSSTPCGSDPSITVEITDGSKNKYSNGEYYRFADDDLNKLKDGAGKQLDIKQSGGYPHPFRLCAGGLLWEDASKTPPCVPTDQDKCGAECVDYVISDTNRDNTCNSVLMPPSGVPVWYVCKVAGHNMYKQVY